MLLASLLGFGNIEVIVLLSVFGTCFTILMLFTALTRVYRITERAATFLVPLMLVVSAWLSKVMYAAML